jgi:hypothetical protein
MDGGSNPSDDSDDESDSNRDSFPDRGRDIPRERDRRRDQRPEANDLDNEVTNQLEGDDTRVYSAGRLRSILSTRRKRGKNDIYAKYHAMIDARVGTAVVPPTGPVPNIRMQAPKHYQGEPDIEKFESWLQQMLRWMQFYQQCGDELDERRVIMTGMLVDGPARVWYDDVVEGTVQGTRKWKFREVIIGLYNRFIHESSIQSAADRFQKVRYDPEKGLAAFSQELDRYAARMSSIPDAYTFKSQLMMGMPEAMLDHLLDKGINAEDSRLKDILEQGRVYEEGLKIKRRYADRHAALKRGTSNSTNNLLSKKTVRIDTTNPTSRRQYRPMRKDSRQPSNHQERGSDWKARKSFPSSLSHQSNGRPASRGTNRSRPTSHAARSPGPSAKVKDARKKDITCFTCGMKGHYANDDECPKRTSAKMYATREVVNDTSDAEVGYEAGRSDNDQDGYQSDQESQEESQESSEGEDVEFDEFEDLISDGEYMGTMRFAHMRVETRPLDSPDILDDEDLPDLQSSDEESDDDDPAYEDCIPRMQMMAENEGPSRKVGVTVLKKSSKMLERPKRKAADIRPLVGFSTIKGQKAFTLFDSGCTADAVSPELARIANLKVHPLENPVPLQLGTVGSRSKINYGVTAPLEYGPLKSDSEYFDVVNIDRYDAIIGIPLMRKHDIVLEPARNCVKVRGTPTPALSEGEEDKEMARRYAMRQSRDRLPKSSE